MIPRSPEDGVFGTVLRRRDRGPFVAKETAYGPDTAVPAHAHADLNVCLVLAGACTERRDGETRRYVGPSLTLNVPSSGHEFSAGPDGVRCFSVQVAEPWLREFREERNVDVVPLVNVGDPILVSAALRLHREQREDDLSGLALESLLIDALALMLGIAQDRPGGAPPMWLRRARELMDERFAEPLTLEGIAREVGVHRVHLARVFRAHHGTTVGDYIRRRRLEHALRMIANGDVAFGRVALRAGFYDQSHFNRWFRDLTGLTPTRFQSLVAPPRR